jgi:hypothetical protein
MYNLRFVAISRQLKPFPVEASPAKLVGGVPNPRW